LVTVNGPGPSGRLDEVTPFPTPWQSCHVGVTHVRRVGVTAQSRGGCDGPQHRARPADSTKICACHSL